MANPFVEKYLAIKKRTLLADERTDPDHEIKILLLYEIALLEILVKQKGE